jgi:hypothetical protein
MAKRSEGWTKYHVRMTEESAGKPGGRKKKPTLSGSSGKKNVRHPVYHGSVFFRWMVL